jgi:DNA-binding response OmpR family regulator
MALQALVVCRDGKTVATLKRALAHLQIGAEVCRGFREALDLSAQRRFEAVIVDATPHRAARFISGVREVTSHKMVVSLILNGRTSVQDAFAMGANFVLYAPLTFERALHGMQAAKSLMFPQHRRHFRWRLHRGVHISFDGRHEIEAVVVDISVGGLAVQMSRRVEVNQGLHVRLQLPGYTEQMELKGEVAWADTHGRAGIRFIQLPKATHQKIKSWLYNASSGGRDSSPAAELARAAGRS